MIKVAATTVINGHIYITTGTVSGNTITHDTNEIVDIWSEKIEYDYNNDLKIRPIPESKGNRGKIPISQIVDIKSITEVLSVQGHLIDEDGSSAKTKRNILLNLAKSINLVDNTKSELTIVWGTTDATNEQTVWTKNTAGREHGVFVNKIKFTETGGYVGEVVSTTADVNPPERKIQIQVQLVRGKDI